MESILTIALSNVRPNCTPRTFTSVDNNTSTLKASPTFGVAAGVAKLRLVPFERTLGCGVEVATSPPPMGGGVCEGPSVGVAVPTVGVWVAVPAVVADGIVVAVFVLAAVGTVVRVGVAVGGPAVTKSCGEVL